MDEYPDNNFFSYQFPDEYFAHEQHSINLYAENKIEDQKNVSTGENHISNGSKVEKNDNSDNQFINTSNSIYNNMDNIINIEKNSDNKNLVNEGLSLNCDILQENNKIEQPNLNHDTSISHYNTVNGKPVMTTNEMMTNKLQEMFKNSEIDVDKLTNMQWIRKKKKRRTKREIDEEKEKEKENTKEIKIEKKRGRLKKNIELNINLNVNHPKDADDNIIKKINTFLMEQIRLWLNKSFLNENLTDFETEKLRKRNKKRLFMKLSPTIISTQIKKKFIMKILETKFKDIFYYNNLSSKYKNVHPDNNKILIDEIYKETKQYFVIFILEMTFQEGLNYFNGQIQDEQVIIYFKKNYNFTDDLIYKFINNFGKIGKLHDKLNKNKDKDDEELKNYLVKINVLSLNYKVSFEKKYCRGENKKKVKENNNSNNDNSNNENSNNDSNNNNKKNNANDIELIESKDKNDISSNNCYSQQNPYETYSHNNENFNNIQL